MKKGWEIKKLGEVCETGAGGTPLKTHKEYYDNGNVPWLRSGEVCKKDITESEMFITREGLNNSSAKLFPKNTVLIAMYGATAGQVGILRFESSTNQAICGILPNDRIIPEFIYYKFLEGKDKLVKQAVGGAQPNISQIKIKNTLIPIPPLSEQKRIVSILDRAFSAIERSKNIAQQNLNNAKELFQSKLQAIFDNGKLKIENGEWEEKKLGEVCETGSGGTPLKTHKEYYEGGHIPWLRSGEVCKKNITECEMYITNQGLKNSSAKLFPKNTVLIAMYGATAGQVGILRFESTTNQAVCGILPNNKIIPEFIYYKFLEGKEKLVKQAVGGAQPNISQIKIKNTKIPIPPLSEQKHIVALLDALQAETKKLETIYQQKITNLEELKKSILQKAFSGQLTVNNG